MSFDWKHLALGIVIGLILGMWGYATYFCKAEVHVENSPPVIVHDTVTVTEWKTDTFHHFITKYVTITDTDTVFMSNEIIKDYMNIREYNRMYDFGNACIDVNSLVFQNELAYQKVTYSAYKDASNNPVSFPKWEAFTGLHLNNLPSYSSLDLSLTLRHSRNLFQAGWSLNGHGFSLGWERKIF